MKLSDDTGNVEHQQTGLVVSLLRSLTAAVQFDDFPRCSQDNVLHEERGPQQDFFEYCRRQASSGVLTARDTHSKPLKLGGQPVKPEVKPDVSLVSTEATDSDDADAHAEHLCATVELKTHDTGEDMNKMVRQIAKAAGHAFDAQPSRSVFVGVALSLGRGDHNAKQLLKSASVAVVVVLRGKTPWRQSVHVHGLCSHAELACVLQVDDATKLGFGEPLLNSLGLLSTSILRSARLAGGAKPLVGTGRAENGTQVVFKACPTIACLLKEGTEVMEDLGNEKERLNFLWNDGTMVDSFGSALISRVQWSLADNKTGETLCLFLSPVGTPLELPMEGLKGECALELFDNIFEALKRIESAGIVHRDVQPDNVVWDEEAKRYVLVDFGFAITVGEALTEHVGTTEFASLRATHQRIEASTQSAWSGRDDFEGLYFLLFSLLINEIPPRDADHCFYKKQGWATNHVENLAKRFCNKERWGTEHFTMAVGRLQAMQSVLFPQNAEDTFTFDFNEPGRQQGRFGDAISDAISGALAGT